MTRPALSTLNPRFRYTPAVATDIRKTFKRARKAVTAGATAKRNARAPANG